MASSYLRKLLGLSFDEEFGGSPLIVIHNEHDKIHDGEMFNVHRSNDEASLLADDASMDLWVSVPAGTFPHMTWGFWVSGLAQWYVYETPTVSAEGTAITPWNRNRNSTTAALTVVKHTPTVSAPGTALHSGAWFGQAAGPGQSSGSAAGISRSGQEVILKEGITYLFRVTAREADILVNQMLDWYE